MCCISFLFIFTVLICLLNTLYIRSTVFVGFGGGWGYTCHSVEAIQFNCSMDISLGGFGLFGGRGTYAAKIKVSLCW